MGVSPAHAAGAHLVKDIVPGAESSGAFDLEAVRGIVYFEAATPTGSCCWLWRSNGTAAGTRLVREIVPTDGSLTRAGNTLFFVADDGEHGTELWTSDGTKSGTTLVRDIRVGDESSSPLT